MPKKRTSDPAQVRQSEADRKARGECRVVVGAWVKTEHKDEARIAGKAAFLKAVKKFKRRDHD